MRYLKAYIPVLLWMTVIYIGSTDVGSSRNTSRFIGPFLRWLKPDISPEAIKAVQVTVRKGAHLTLYAVLASLTWRAQRALFGGWNQWHSREFWIIAIFCFLYAASDELHQSFVSSRQGSPYDVMIDTAGAVCALLAIRYWILRRARPAPAH